MLRTISLTKSFRFGLALCLTGLLIVQLILPVQRARATVGTTWLVNTLTDGVYGTCDASRCTLSDAVKLAHSSDTIIFDPSLSGTITIYDTLKPNDNVTIHGSPNVIISGGNNKQIFRFWHCTNANLDNLTLVDGSYDLGGAIYIDTGCTLNLANSTLKGNSASASGGGIQNYGTLNLTDSLLQDNTSSSGGAIACSGSDTITLSTLTVTRSTLKENIGANGGGGLNIYFCTATVTDSTFDSNSSSVNGGGIYNGNSTLTVTGSTFMNNSVPPASGKGGGIYNWQSTVNITNSTLTANSAFNGGAIYQEAGTINLTNSTLAGNSAANLGAGILNYATLNISNNIIAHSGAGLDCDNEATLSTNTHNLVADGSCSAAFSGDPKLNPLADNGGPTWTMALQSDSPAIDNGDNTVCPEKDQRGVPRSDGNCDIGAYEYGTATPGSLQKSEPTDGLIVTSGSPTLSWSTSTNADFYEYCYAPTTGCTNWISAGTSTSAGLNGLYFAQLYYWQVRAVAAGGPVAADLGSYWSFTTPGLPNATASAATGITDNGATLNGMVNAHHADATVTFEYGPTTSYGSFVTADPSPVSGASDTAVSKTITGLDFNTLYHFRVDAVNSMGTTQSGDLTFSTPCYNPASVDAIGDAGAGTLRQAIRDVCTGGTINFASTLAGKTILLTSSTLEIPRSMTIDGSSLNPPVTISGNNNVRIFLIDNNVSASLDGLVLADGSASDNGGAIENMGTLTVMNSTLENNTAAKYGGAIDTRGTLTVSNSTFDSNHSPYGGGAINIEGSGGSSTVIDSTFSGNHSDSGCGGAIEVGLNTNVINSTFAGNTAEYGGAIVNWDNLSVTNSTFSGNSATTPTHEYEGGAGIYNDSEMNLVNTIIANSTSGGDCINDDSDGATIHTNTDNLVEDGSCSAGGVNFRTGDPLLGLLADNGGPTQTMALLPGSPAINAGDYSTCTNAPISGQDQRGVTRPSACDIGAFESQGFTLGSLTGTPQGTDVGTAFASPLGLTVTSAFGEPVAGGQVTFTPPSTGASAAVTGSPATIASNGKVSVTATANGTSGKYNVVASTSGATSVNFSLANFFKFYFPLVFQ